jgi:Dolichyl-phosphate-mannose-protein mannosyltransferase
VLLIVFALRHALVLAILAGTAWACGQLALGFKRASPDENAAPWPFVVALGLAVLAQAALLLGLGGWLRAPVVAALVIGLNVAAAGAWRRALNGGGGTLAASAATSALVAPPFLLALYPPLGFDQTLYHLPFVRAFAATGGLPFLPALRFPAFPPLAELLGAAVLLFGDDVSTQIVGWLAHAACVGLVFTWTRERASTAGGFLAAAMLAGSPIVVYLSATGYVEPLVGLFGVTSLYAADRARQRADGIDIGWIAVSAVFAGSAAGVKYLGLFFVPAAALLLIRRRAWRTTIRGLVWYGVVVVLALAPTYGRLVALTGNPLFPFYPAVFGSSLWDAQEFLGRRGVDQLLAASTFLWDATFRRQAVGGLPSWSPAFAFGAPLALLAAWRQPALRLRLLLLIAIGYLALAPVGAHYFLGIAPLWCVIVGVAASGLAGASSWGRRLLIAVAVTVALGGDAYTLYRVHKLGWPPTTRDGRERLLSAELPLYPAIAFLNRVGDRGNVYGVHAERMVDYADATLLGDYNGPWSYSRVEARASELGSLAKALDDPRASYLLIPAHDSSWTARASADPRLSPLYRDANATIYRLRPASGRR